MQIKLNVDLSPIIEEDKKGGGFITYFEKYPNAIGDGDSKEAAMDSLAMVFSVMLQNEP